MYVFIALFLYCGDFINVLYVMYVYDIWWYLPNMHN